MDLINPDYSNIGCTSYLLAQLVNPTLLVITGTFLYAFQKILQSTPISI